MSAAIWILAAIVLVVAGAVYLLARMGGCDDAGPQGMLEREDEI